MIVYRGLKFIGKAPIEVYRCETCETIVTGSQDSLKSHAGHTLKRPCNVSLFEYLGLFLGFIR